MPTWVNLRNLTLSEERENATGSNRQYPSICLIFQNPLKCDAIYYY